MCRSLSILGDDIRARKGTDIVADMISLRPNLVFVTDPIELTPGPVRVPAHGSNRVELTDGPVTASAGGIRKGLHTVVLMPEGADPDVVVTTFRITGDPITGDRSTARC